MLSAIKPRPRGKGFMYGFFIADLPVRLSGGHARALLRRALQGAQRGAVRRLAHLLRVGRAEVHRRDALFHPCRLYFRLFRGQIPRKRAEKSTRIPHRLRPTPSTSTAATRGCSAGSFPSAPTSRSFRSSSPARLCGTATWTSSSPTAKRRWTSSPRACSASARVWPKRCCWPTRFTSCSVITMTRLRSSRPCWVRG